MIFSKSLLIFLEIPSTTKVFCSELNFFYVFCNIDIIIIMQEQSLITIQNTIEQILEINHLTQLEKRTILQRIIAKISKQEKSKENLNFQIFETEQYNIYHPSPQSIIRHDNHVTHNHERQSIIDNFEINSTPIRTECHMHNLQSELKGESVSSFLKYTKNEQRIKKKFIINSLNIVRVCLAKLLQSIHKAYGHLTMWRYGKDTKYQVQAIYCRSIKTQIQYLKGQLFPSKGIEQILSNLVDICQSIEQALPLYEKQFIKKDEEFIWPTSSQIFKIFKKQA